MDATQIERYARHIILREIGGPGQARLRRARVVMIGAGGLGAPALLYLAAAGVGSLRIIDDDAISLSNLQRQILYRTDDLGDSKAGKAAEALRALNPDVSVEVCAVRFEQGNAAELAQGADLVIDGSDNFTTRRLANAAARAAGAALLMGAVGAWEGQVALFDPHEGPCYACVFPKDPQHAPSCAEAGVLGALTGVVGTFMAVEAIKRLAGAGESAVGRLFLYDALAGVFRDIKIKPKPGCPVCGGAPTNC